MLFRVARASVAAFRLPAFDLSPQGSRHDELCRAWYDAQDTMMWDVEEAMDYLWLLMCSWESLCDSMMPYGSFAYIQIYSTWSYVNVTVSDRTCGACPRDYQEQLRKEWFFCINIVYFYCFSFFFVILV